MTDPTRGQTAPRIALLADHPDLVETIARWHWEEWHQQDPVGSLPQWIERMQHRTNRDRIPIAFVAFDGEEPVGSTLLVERDMETHRELTPWLAGVYVVPTHRGQGVGAVLVRHTVRQAAALGMDRLYLHTETARGFYEKLGWRAILQEIYLDTPTTVMEIEPARGAVR